VVSFPGCIQSCQFIPGASFGNMACAAGEHFLVGSCMLFPVLLCHEWQILLFPSVLSMPPSLRNIVCCFLLSSACDLFLCLFCFFLAARLRCAVSPDNYSGITFVMCSWYGLPSAMEPHVWSHNLFIFPIATYFTDIFFGGDIYWRSAPLLFKHPIISLEELLY
jgi:hypothetical protein